MSLRYINFFLLVAALYPAPATAQSERDSLHRCSPCVCQTKGHTIKSRTDGTIGSFETYTRQVEAYSTQCSSLNGFGAARPSYPTSPQELAYWDGETNHVSIKTCRPVSNSALPRRYCRQDTPTTIGTKDEKNTKACMCKFAGSHRINDDKPITKGVQIGLLYTQPKLSCTNLGSLRTNKSSVTQDSYSFRGSTVEILACEDASEEDIANAPSESYFSRLVNAHSSNLGVALSQEK